MLMTRAECSEWGVCREEAGRGRVVHSENKCTDGTDSRLCVLSVPWEEANAVSSEMATYDHSRICAVPNILVIWNWKIRVDCTSLRSEVRSVTSYTTYPLYYRGNVASNRLVFCLLKMITTHYAYTGSCWLKSETNTVLQLQFKYKILRDLALPVRLSG